MTKSTGTRLDQLTAIVCAYLSRNPVAESRIPSIIETISDGLDAAANREKTPVPASDPKSSVTSSHITCLECGRKMKVLKRHVSAAHGLSLANYRAKWGLPADYPSVAPDYSKKRGGLAKSHGLGNPTKTTKTNGHHSPSHSIASH